MQGFCGRRDDGGNKAQGKPFPTTGSAHSILPIFPLASAPLLIRRAKRRYNIFFARHSVFA